MGEKGKKEDKPNKAGGGGEKKTSTGGSGDKKKEDGPTTVVLKVELHCEGCALKVKRSVKGFKGVESVSADLASNKLTVVGKVDPVALRDRVETKTHKKVEIVSPSQNKPKDAGGAAGGAKKPGAGDSQDQKKPAAGDQKPKGPQVSTVMLKIRLHCEGCIKRIVKTINKTKGVESVTVDAAKDLVTVKGTMDAKSLPTDLKDKLKRSVEVVAPKKDDGGEKKKEGGGGKGGEKKEGGGGGGQKGGGGEKDGGAEKMVPMATMNKMEYGYPIPGPYGFGYGVEMAHAPQMFSDENPNACSIM